MYNDFTFWAVGVGCRPRVCKERFSSTTTLFFARASVNSAILSMVILGKYLVRASRNLPFIMNKAWRMEVWVSLRRSWLANLERNSPRGPACWLNGKPRFTLLLFCDGM